MTTAETYALVAEVLTDFTIKAAAIIAAGYAANWAWDRRSQLHHWLRGPY